MKKKINWRIFGTVFGAGAFVVSAYFTCDLLIAEATLGREKLVHFLWGLVCQGFLAFFCTALFVTDGPKRFVYGVLFLLALVLSLQGTIAQRAMNRQSQLNSEISNDSEYMDLKKTKARLDSKIEKFEDKILEFIDAKMIKNGVVPTEAKLKKAEEQLAEIERKLANYSHKTGSEANAPFIAWARFCNEDATDEELTKIAENSHMWVTIGYAVLLDVGGPVAFGAVISPHVGNVIRRRRRRKEEDASDVEELDRIRTAATGSGNSYSSHTSNSHTSPESKPSSELETLHVDSVDTKSVRVGTNVDSVNTVPRIDLYPDNEPEKTDQKNQNFEGGDKPELRGKNSGLKNRLKDTQVKPLPRGSKNQNSKPEYKPESQTRIEAEKNQNSVSEKTDQKNQNFKPKFQKRVKGQRSSNRVSVYSHDLLPQYIKALFEPPKKNGSLNGWKRIGNRLYYTQRVAEQCHEECKRLELTKLRNVNGKLFTYPKMGSSDMLKVVKRVHGVG